MSWLYSQALVAEYLADTCSGGEPFVPSSSTPTPLAYCAPDRMKVFSRLSRFGTTCGPLTDDHGNRLLTWFLVGSHVRTLVQRERAPELAEPVRDCGMKCPESFARFDPASFSWKTPPSLLTGDSIPFSGRWPRWGTMRNGACSERTTSAPRTSGTGSGYWLTPRASDTGRGENPETFVKRMGDRSMDCDQSLPAQVRRRENWPTPNVPNGGRSCAHVTDWRGSTAYHNGKKVQVGLEHAVKYWPSPRANDAEKRGATKSAVYATPTKSDAMGGPGRSDHRMGADNLRTQIGGQLNPTWVEWLMGWPLGWTALNVSETDKSPPWRHWRSVFCMPACSGMNTTEAIK